MSALACSFFGHRDVLCDSQLEQKLFALVEYLIVCCKVTVFLFGSRSNFDSLCYKVVSKLKQKYSFIKRVAYTCKSETCVLPSQAEKTKKIYSHFDNLNLQVFEVEEEFEHKTKYTSCRASYVKRNQSMIDNSDFCVFFMTKTICLQNAKLQKRAGFIISHKVEQNLLLIMPKKRKRLFLILKIFDKLLSMFFISVYFYQTLVLVCHQNINF